MWKEFTVQGNTQYLDILPKILSQYNNTKHSSIKMTPVEASKKENESTVYFSLYGDMEQLSSKPWFMVGDKVRISKYKTKMFDKGYTPNWTKEIFLVDKIQSANPITYRLKDLNNEEIQGNFYEPELLKAKQDKFSIEKVIRRDYKKKQALVKWLGYSVWRVVCFKIILVSCTISLSFSLCLLFTAFVEILWYKHILCQLYASLCLL